MEELWPGLLPPGLFPPGLFLPLPLLPGFDAALPGFDMLSSMSFLGFLTLLSFLFSALGVKALVSAAISLMSGSSSKPNTKNCDKSKAPGEKKLLC